MQIGAGLAFAFIDRSLQGTAAVLIFAVEIGILGNAGLLRFGKITLGDQA
jgi:hypothetical protein